MTGRPDPTSRPLTSSREADSPPRSFSSMVGAGDGQGRGLAPGLVPTPDPYPPGQRHPGAERTAEARTIWTSPRRYTLETRRAAAQVLAEARDPDHAAEAETFLAATRRPLIFRPHDSRQT